jgi:hypothetical protein
MRVTLIHAIRDVLYVTLFFALMSFVLSTSSNAQMSEAKILEEISKQETGRLPGAKIVSSSGGDRASFSVTVEFDAFEPITDFERLERFPGDLKIPKCYYFDDEDIVYTDNCSSVSPPAKQITKFYDEDGNVLTGVGETTVTHVDEGAELLFGGKEIFAVGNEFEKYPADGTIFKIFATDPTTGNLILGTGGTPTIAQSVYTEFDDPINNNTACDKIYPATGAYPPGYRYDYDTSSGALEPILPGGVMRYPIKIGQPIFNQSCQYFTDCEFDEYLAANPSAPTDISDPVYNASPYRRKAGDEIWLWQAINPSLPIDATNRRCGRLKAPQGGPIISVRGPERIEPTIVPLFLQRFRDDYSRPLYLTLLDLRPKGTNVSTVTLTGEQYIPALPAPYDTTLISLESEYIGDYFCVFAYSKNPNIVWRIEDKAPQTMEEVLDLIPAVKKDRSDLGSDFAKRAGVDSRHCVLAPPPTPVSQTLTFNALFSPVCINFSTADSRWSGPFTSAVVECIEQTLSNIFITPHVAGDPTFFEKIQLKFQVLIRYLLVLYVILFGYRLVIRKHVPDQGEWMWFALRVGFIVLFVMTSGMATVFSYTMVSLKSLSLIVTEAGLAGNTNYCDFRGETYAAGKEYIRLWDMIDCKTSKYLGIGDNLSDPKAPQVIWVGVTAVVSTYLGIPILILTIIVLTSLLSLIIRAVHLYILSFISLVLLFYISPLLIPAVLFEYTKDIFYKWFQKVMSNFLQPVLLFAFLSFALAAVESVFFGGNNLFVPKVGGTIPYHIGGGTGVNGRAIELLECGDPNALACIYQTAKMTTYTPLPFPFNKVNFYKINLNGKELQLLIGLLKLLLICFVIKILLDSSETMVGKITGADPVGRGGDFGDSVGRGRGAPALAPSDSIGYQSAVVSGGYNAVATPFKMIGRGGALAMAAMRAGTGGETLLEKDRRKRAAGERGDGKEKNLLEAAIERRKENKLSDQENYKDVSLLQKDRAKRFNEKVAEGITGRYRGLSDESFVDQDRRERLSVRKAEFKAGGDKAVGRSDESLMEKNVRENKEKKESRGELGIGVEVKDIVKNPTNRKDDDDKK